MGFLKPKVPKPVPPPNPAQTPISADAGIGFGLEGRQRAGSSLISTSSQGLKRRASTQRTSLIGGA